MTEHQASSRKKHGEAMKQTTSRRTDCYVATRLAFDEVGGKRTGFPPRWIAPDGQLQFCILKKSR
jgi:hypothetical protein